MRNVPTLWNVPIRSVPRIGNAPEEVFFFLSRWGMFLHFGTFLLGALPELGTFSLGTLLELGVLLKRLFLDLSF